MARKSRQIQESATSKTGSHTKNRPKKKKKEEAGITPKKHVANTKNRLKLSKCTSKW